MHDFRCLGTFSLIFCRNVMIYFDKPTQQDVVNRLAERIERGGVLFTRHSKTLTEAVRLGAAVDVLPLRDIASAGVELTPLRA